MFRACGEKNPGEIYAVFGLNYVEEQLIWQSFILQSMLAMKKIDPSFGAIYSATVSGAYIIVHSIILDSNY